MGSEIPFGSYDSSDDRERPQLWVPGADTPELGFKTAGSEPIGITVSGESALTHHPEAARPAFERIGETAVGPITVVRADEGLSYGPEDFANSLSLLPRDRMPTLQSKPHLLIAPDRQDIIIRTNLTGMRPEYTNPEEVIRHMARYESALAELMADGLPTLKHSVFVIENDEYYHNKTVAYIASERLANERALDDSTLPDAGAINTMLCRIVTRHLTRMPPDRPFLREIAFAFQYSEDGRLFDYDPNVSTSLRERYIELGHAGEWVETLPASEAATKRGLTEEIKRADELLIAADPKLAAM